MKKISILLSALAFAVVGLLASCSNEYVNASTKNYSYAYEVTGGSITSQYVSSDTSTSSSSSSESVDSLKSGTAIVSWTEDNVNNYSYIPYYIDLEYVYDNKVSYTMGSKTTASEYKGKNGNLSISLRKINDDYYYLSNGKYNKCTLTGNFGDDEVTLSYIFSYDGETSSTTATARTSQIVSITMSKVKSE